MLFHSALYKNPVLTICYEFAKEFRKQRAVSIGFFVVNNGISDTIVLEILQFNTSPAKYCIRRQQQYTHVGLIPMWITKYLDCQRVWCHPNYDFIVLLWHGNLFHISGLCEGNLLVTVRFLKKGQKFVAFIFLLAWRSRWTYRRIVGDLGHLCDVTVLLYPCWSWPKLIFPCMHTVLSYFNWVILTLLSVLV